MRVLTAAVTGRKRGRERRVCLPDEEPEVFSAVLEFMYKGMSILRFL
jgi:hypothetical protein